MVRKLRISMLSLLAFVLFSPFASVTALACDVPPVIFDTFRTLPLKSVNPSANWWIINWGHAEDGSVLRAEDYCGSNTCVSAERERMTTFARLQQQPGQLEGYYYNVEVSEMHTGFAYGEETRWTPEVGHPVVLSTRVRWSENYNADGTGGALGSSGIWLWNSPIDVANGTFYGQNAIGFSYVDAASVIGQGLNAGLYLESWPVEQAPIDINMAAWNFITIIWSVDAAGQQTATYRVNGEQVASFALPMPMESLSPTIWNDNQRAGWEGIELTQATEEQNFDVDFLGVVKL